MKIKQMTLVTVLSVAAGSAFAGDWYALGSFGQSKVDGNAASEVNAELIDAGVTGLSSSFDDKDTSYKLQLGYSFTPNFAVEGGYIDLGKFQYSAAFTGPAVGSAVAEVKAAGINLGAVASYPMNDQFEIFGKLGIINAKVEASATASGGGVTLSENISETKVKGYWGVGAAYNFNKQLGLHLAWERFNKLGDDEKTGESDVDLVSLGLKLSF
ncbi:outer membrane beta-barrel protein [Pseudomonadales bacterium]|nr:outer membrane beta-barrel protein [Pseudomonadales bacterium]